MISPFQEDLLVNQGDCPLHYHSSDRTPTHDTLTAIHQVEKQVFPTANYAVQDQDDWVICNNTFTVTLPPARNGRRVSVALITALKTVTVSPTGTDTINGAASTTLITQWQVKHFKALATGGWLAY